METDIGAIGYALATATYAVLTVLLIVSKRHKQHGSILIFAALTTMLWAAAATYAAYFHATPMVADMLEFVRNGLWLRLLWKIFVADREPGGAASFRLRRMAYLATGVFAAALVYTLAGLAQVVPEWFETEWSGRLVARIAVTVLGLGLIEQLYRNANEPKRWAIKHICLGLGGLFVFDFYMYADALLFRRVDSGIWGARGIIDALVVPLIAVSAARNPQWALAISVSRGVVLHTATLFGAGLYLLGMAAAGYYIRIFGGGWGNVLQAVFLFGAVLVLLLLLFSGALRARLKVLLSKHFFSYKYDYREEWLRFTHTLSAGIPGENLRERSLRALADLVDSPGAQLWVEQGAEMTQVAQWNMPMVTVKEPVQGALCSFLRERQWVLNLHEYAAQPDVYGDLRLPDWLGETPRAWLVLPLILQDRLLGFAVIADARTRRDFNWEDSDLLKTAGRQLAVYLAQLQSAEALVEARQFESFNRLSTYVVHDLKNIVAQLSLLLANAQKHKHKAEFQEDMLATVDNATQRMTRLLGQLRTGYQSAQQPEEGIELSQLLEQIVRDKSHCRPAPQWNPPKQPLWVVANRERLARVLGHLVQNACEACGADGSVRVLLEPEGDWAVVRVTDDGKGMDETFIRDQLYRPFATTKSGGMGIGAYECREYVRELNGEMRVTSAVGEGSTFSVHLPQRKMIHATLTTNQSAQGASNG